MIVTLKDAQTIVSDHIKIKNTEKLPLNQCFHRVTASNIYATIDQPPFRRSAMDGYAIYKEDTSLDKDHSFQVKGEIDAGDHHEYYLNKDEAYRIMTGAKVPDGANWVVRQEDAIEVDNSVRFTQILKRDNICPIGEDFSKGDLLVNQGQKIDAYILSCLAASGINELMVYKKMRVAIISTGDELCSIDKVLHQGQIYDSSSVYLSSRFKQFGCDVVYNKLVKDDISDIIKVIDDCKGNADLIITTGGVSVGNKDYMEEVMLKQEANILFHGIEVKPGMPTMFSMIGTVPVLSLSGNPYSASCIFELLFPSDKLYIHTVLKNSYKKKRPQLRVVRGSFNGSDVYIPNNQKNGVIKTGIGTNCLVFLPEGEMLMETGSKVCIMMI